MKNYTMKGEAAILLRQDMAEERRREEAAKRDALGPTTFANRAGSYLAIRAAKQLVEAQAELAGRGLEVTDWEMIGGRVAAMELKDTDTGDKTWVDL